MQNTFCALHGSLPKIKVCTPWLQVKGLPHGDLTTLLQLQPRGHPLLPAWGWEEASVTELQDEATALNRGADT